MLDTIHKGPGEAEAEGEETKEVLVGEVKEIEGGYEEEEEGAEEDKENQEDDQGRVTRNMYKFCK